MHCFLADTPATPSCSMSGHPCRLYHVSEEHLKWLTSARDDVTVPRGLLRRAVTEGNQLQQHDGFTALQGNCLAACWACTALLVFHASGGGWHQLHLTVLEQGPTSPIQVNAAMKVRPRMRCVQKQWPRLHDKFSTVNTCSACGHVFCNPCGQLPLVQSSPLTSGPCTCCAGRSSGAGRPVRGPDSASSGMAGPCQSA